MAEALGVGNIESLDKNDYIEFRNELKANGSLSSKFDDEFFNAVYPGRGYKDYVFAPKSKCKVLRDGNEVTVFASELIPTDHIIEHLKK